VRRVRGAEGSFDLHAHPTGNHLRRGGPRFVHVQTARNFRGSKTRVGYDDEILRPSLKNIRGRKRTPRIVTVRGLKSTDTVHPAVLCREENIVSPALFRRIRRTIGDRYYACRDHVFTDAL